MVDGDRDARLVPMTESDLARQVDRVVELFRKSGIRDLAEHVERINHAAGKLGLSRMRVPCALVEREGSRESTRGVGSMIGLKEIRPQVECTIDALVLPDDVSRSYELMDLRLGNICTNIDAEPLPLETFSIEYLRESDRLYTVQQWKTDIVTPAHKVLAIVRQRVHPAPPFRGVLWMRVMPWG